MKNKQHSTGVLAALSAYVLWGVLPLYWKLLAHVPSEEILAHRFIWSLLFIVVMLLCIGRAGSVIQEIRHAFSNHRTIASISLAAILICSNWYVFIATVNRGHVVEASLGYYINPLINVVLATIFLKERLSRWELVSFLLAMSGVLMMTFHYGRVPWAAIFLALTFGFYGLIKKTVPVGEWTGLLIETLLITPFALLYLAFQGNAFITDGMQTSFFLMGAGAATAIPLLLFAAGAKRISFSFIGFLQYNAPTIMFLLGVFLFREPFSRVQLFSFMLIWIGLAIFTISRSKGVFSKGKHNVAHTVHR